VASTNDPFCAIDRAQAMAQDWGADLVSIGERGHVNGDSDLGEWPEGIAWLEQLAGGPLR